MEASNNQKLTLSLTKASEYLLGIAQVQANSLQHEIFSLLSSNYSLNEIKKALKKGTVVLDNLNSVFCQMGIQNTFLVIRRLVQVTNGIGMHVLQRLEKNLVRNPNQFRQSQVFEFHQQLSNEAEINFLQRSSKICEIKPKFNKMKGICLLNENYKRKIDENRQNQPKPTQKKKDDELDESNYKRKLFQKMKQQIESVENELYTPITDQISSFILFERKFLETFNHFEYSEDLQKMTDSLDSSSILTQQFLSKFDLKTQEVSLFKAQIQTLITELRMNNKARNQSISVKFQEIMNKFIKKRLEVYRQASIKLQLYNKIQKEKQQKRVQVGVETVLKDFAAIKNYERKIINLEEKIKFRDEQKQKFLADVLQKVDKQKNTLEMQVLQLKITNSHLVEEINDLKKLRQQLYIKIAEKQAKGQNSKVRKQEITIVMKNGVRIGSNFRSDDNQNSIIQNSNENSGQIISSKKKSEKRRLSNISNSSNKESNSKDKIQETIAEKNQILKSQQEENNEEKQSEKMKKTMISLENESEGIQKQKKVRMKNTFDLEIEEDTQEVLSGSRQPQKKQNKTQKLIRLKGTLSSKSLKLEEGEHKKVDKEIENIVDVGKQNEKVDTVKTQQSSVAFKLQNIGSFKNETRQNQEQLIKQIIKDGGPSQHFGFDKLKIASHQNKVESLIKEAQQNLHNNGESQIRKNEDLKKVGRFHGLKQINKNYETNKQNGQQKQQQKSKYVPNLQNKTNKKYQQFQTVLESSKIEDLNFYHLFSVMFCNGVFQSQEIHRASITEQVSNAKGNKLLNIKSDERVQQINSVLLTSQNSLFLQRVLDEDIRDRDGELQLPPLTHDKKNIQTSLYKKILNEIENINNFYKQKLSLKDIKVQDFITILKSQGPSKLDILRVFEKFNYSDSKDKITGLSQLNVEDFIKIITYKGFDCFEDYERQIKKERSYSVDNTQAQNSAIDLAIKIRSLAKNNNETDKTVKVGGLCNKSVIQKIFLQSMRNRKEESLPDLIIGNRSVHDRQSQTPRKLKSKLKKTYRKKQEIQILLKSIKNKPVLSEESQQRQLPEIKIKSIFRA